METDATRLCALLVGLPDVRVIGVGDGPGWLRVVIEAPGERPACGCGGVVHRHGVREVELVDLPVFGRSARLLSRQSFLGSVARDLAQRQQVHSGPSPPVP